MATLNCGNKIYSNIEAVIFDKDGTLADVESFLKHLGQKRARLIDAQIPGVGEPLLLSFGLEGTRLNPAGSLAVASRRENEIAAAAYIAETGRDWFEALEMARSAFTEADVALGSKAVHTPLFAAARPTLEAMATIGLKLGILSSDTTTNVQDFVQQYQLENYFGLQQGMIEQFSKPDPAFFQLACAQLGVSPQTTLMIGDATVDMVMARRAIAAGCVGVCWGWSEPVPLQEADVMLSQWEDLGSFY